MPVFWLSTTATTGATASTVVGSGDSTGSTVSTDSRDGGNMATRLRAVSAAEVKARHHKYLAAPTVGPKYWGLGTLAFLDAQQGTGKSLLTIDLAAAITRGLSWPDGEKSTMKPANVLFSNVEDDEDADQKPRLVAAGANLKRVKFANDIWDDEESTEHELHFPEHFEPFKAFIKAHSIKLAVLDPAFSHMSPGKALGPVLKELRSIAKETECTIILIRHIPQYLLNKPAGTRGAGGYQVAAHARMGYDLLKDARADEGINRVFLRSGKNNWIGDQPARAFTVNRGVTAEIDGGIFETANLTWEERVIPDKEVLEHAEAELRKDNKSTIDDWLERRLLAAGEQGVEWRTLKAEAEAASFSDKAIRAAGKRLGVVTRGTGRPNPSGRGVTRTAYWYHPEYASV